jgi:hypothetical protein
LRIQQCWYFLPLPQWHGSPRLSFTFPLLAQANHFCRLAKTSNKAQ